MFVKPYKTEAETKMFFKIGGSISSKYLKHKINSI